MASRGFSVSEGRLPTERGWFIGCPSDSLGSMQRGMKRTTMVEKIKDWACIFRGLRKTGFLWGFFVTVPFLYIFIYQRNFCNDQTLVDDHQIGNIVDSCRVGPK